MDYRSICVIRSAGIGDAIFSIPLLQAIRRSQPDAKIHFYGHNDAGDLFRSAGLVDERHKQGPESKIYEGVLEVVGRLGMEYEESYKQRIRDSLGNPDLIIMFSTDPVRASIALELFGFDKFVVESWIPPPITHQAEFMVLALRNAGILEGFRIETVDFKQRAPYTPYLNADRLVVMQPSSGNSIKNWPLENYMELSQMLQSFGKQVIVLQGPEEYKLDYKAKFAGSFVMSLTLKDVAGLLSLNPIFIGNDSGITHMSGIMGNPTLALFGPTDPTQWGTLGPNVHIVRTCQEVGEGAIYACKDERCMEDMTPNFVMTQFMRSFH